MVYIYILIKFHDLCIYMYTRVYNDASFYFIPLCVYYNMLKQLCKFQLVINTISWFMNLRVYKNVGQAYWVLQEFTL